jgi:hypothetical protein
MGSLVAAGPLADVTKLVEGVDTQPLSSTATAAENATRMMVNAPGLYNVIKDMKGSWLYGQGDQSIKNRLGIPLSGAR